MSYFNTNLKYLRESKGLSKNKLGELAGVNQTTIGRWENGEITPTIDNVVDLMSALNLDIDFLPDFLGKDLSSQQPPIKELKGNLIAFENALKDKGILNKDDEMSKEDYDKIMNFVEVNKNLLLNKDEKK